MLRLSGKALDNEDLDLNFEKWVVRLGLAEREESV